jgi:hypothetical protein
MAALSLSKRLALVWINILADTTHVIPDSRSRHQLKLIQGDLENKMRRSVVALWMLGLPISYSHAAEIKLQSYADIPRDTSLVDIEGEIIEGDFNTFDLVISTIPSSRPITVTLTGPGGSLIESIAIGTRIRERRAKTFAYGVCASACAYVWLSGSSRGINTETELGFHGAYTFDGRSAYVDATSNAILGAYLAKLGYGIDVIAFVTRTELQEFTWMKASDARKLGIQFVSIKNIADLQALLQR